MVERLVLHRAAFLGDGLVPGFRVAEHRVHVEHDAPERMLAMFDHLTQMVFGTSLQHGVPVP